MYNDWNDGVNDDDCNQCDHFEPQRRGANVDMTQGNPTNDQRPSLGRGNNNFKQYCRAVSLLVLAPPVQYSLKMGWFRKAIPIHTRFSGALLTYGTLIERVKNN